MHTRLAEAGLAVYGYDHHGHGESEPKEARERALVHDFNHLVSRFDRLLKQMMSPTALLLVESTSSMDHAGFPMPHGILPHASLPI